MSNLINKAKVALSGNKTHDNVDSTGYGATQTTGYGTGQTGTAHGHGVGTTGTSTTAGPHNSSVLNKADPRVDSDLDHRGNPTSHVGGQGTSHTTGDYGTGVGTTGTSTTAGPHNSSALNKADPRVDSDLDHRGNPTSHVGGQGTSHTTGGYGTGAGTTGTSGNAGPHNSALLNKLDPRVDSDRDHRGNPTSAAGGYGTSQNTGYGASSGVGTTGTAGTTTTAGHQGHHHGHGNHGQAPIHNSITTGQPGVGSHTGYGGKTGTTTSTTTTQSTTTTSQPVHNSNVLNKLDPRVKTDGNGNAL